MKAGMPSSFLDFAFKPIKENTGGRLRFAISGGAPLPKETHEFLAVALCPVLQGYGMTETCGVISIQHPDQGERVILGQVGPPSPSIEVKLVNVPNSNYSVKDTPNPRGEIYVRGPSVTQGYYKQPKVTKETITDDGWLMTGDIGEFLPDGSISIIDRRKNLVKLSNGEYIALEKLESIYKTAAFVQNVCVWANSEHAYPVAIVAPIIPDLLKYAQEKGIVPAGQTVEIDELSQMPELKKMILGVLLDVAKAADLKPAEKLGGIVLAKEEWTPQNGMLVCVSLSLEIATNHL